MITDEQAIELVRSGYFRIDDDGSVWRCMMGTRTGNRRTIAPTRADSANNTGYLLVRYGKRGSITAHRLVWLAIHGPIPPGVEINHKNLNKGDNRIDNLELLTHEANVQHAFANGAAPSSCGPGEANANHKLTASAVSEIRRLAAAGEPKRALARRFNVTPTLVRKIVAGRAWRNA